MYITAVSIVLTAAIVVFFSQEFGRFFKKIFAIPGAKLIIPLVIASWIIEYYEGWGLWLLWYYKKGLHYILRHTAAYFSWSAWALSFVHILQLFILASLPVWIAYAVAKSKGLYERWPYTYHVGISCWIITAVLLTVHRP